MSENGAQRDAGDLEAGARVIPVQWENVEDVPITFANSFASQIVAAGEFVLIVGQLTPPLLLAASDEQFAAVDVVKARTVFRLGLSEQRLRELSDLLLRQLTRNRQIQNPPEEEEQS